MARRQEQYTIEGGRDDGKTFLLTEMPADQAEQFAWKAISAAARGGLNVPAGMAGSGFAGLAQMGFNMLMSISFDDLQPLLYEMMQCVKLIPDPGKPSVTRPIDREDIEEASTYFKLRAEVFKLHVGFSKAAES